MNKRVKKDLIYLLIGLTIAFGICFAIFDIIIEDGIACRLGFLPQQQNLL